MAEGQKNRHIIKSVVPGSIAAELSLAPGDELMRINGKKIKDVFDYHYLTNEEYLTLIVRKPSGEEWELEIEKEYEEDLGICFMESLMDQYRSCRNKCIFCFIDQMPPGMRETLYFKDDDARLSFLQGNYITLTNMGKEDVERICFYKLSPINISVHTMNPELRCKMLNNRFAGEALGKIRKFYEAGITMNAQIVLCKGVNDGKELDYSIGELEKYLPYMESVSVVPAGKTKYREGLFPLMSFSKEESADVIFQISSWQEKLFARYGTRFVYASDEWFLTAGLSVPPADYYGGYGQLENGVGMVRLLMDETKEALATFSGDGRKQELSMATGVLIAPVLSGLLAGIKEKFPNITVHLYPIVNHFFGEQITVAGLVTGQDLVAQLAGKPLGDFLCVPSVMVRPKERDFLDDYTIKDVETTLQTRVRIVKSDGASFVRAIIEPFEGEFAQGYTHGR
ncbi:MAG: DUF512 domain-containing protein [Lachnospiraceae bacterium]|nr:DUF512 domain-containing protein [Lachnospiraceae bacterium]